MNHEKRSVHEPNEMLCGVIGRVYSIETGDSSSAQISCVIRRANLATPVVLGALYLAVLAREKAAAYIEGLRAEMEVFALRKETLQKRIDSCLSLCSNTPLLFSISLVLSSKYLVDRSYVNRTWANILMVDKAAVNEKERTLLHIFGHTIEITETTISGVLKTIQKHAPEKSVPKESRFFRMLKKLSGCIFKPSK